MKQKTVKVLVLDDIILLEPGAKIILRDTETWEKFEVEVGEKWVHKLYQSSPTVIENIRELHDSLKTFLETYVCLT